MYNETIVSQLNNLKYLTALKNSNVTVISKKNKFGDVVKYFAQINKDDVIQRISFKASGCSHFLVYCDYFCSIVEGKTVKNALKIKMEDLEKFAPIDEPKTHIVDIILGTFALLIKKYRKGVEKGLITPCEVEMTSTTNEIKKEKTTLKKQADIHSTLEDILVAKKSKKIVTKEVVSMETGVEKETLEVSSKSIRSNPEKKVSKESKEEEKVSKVKSSNNSKKEVSKDKSSNNSKKEVSKIKSISSKKEVSKDKSSINSQKKQSKVKSAKETNKDIEVIVPSNDTGTSISVEQNIAISKPIVVSQESEVEQSHQDISMGVAKEKVVLENNNQKIVRETMVATRRIQTHTKKTTPSSSESIYVEESNESINNSMDSVKQANNILTLQSMINSSKQASIEKSETENQQDENMKNLSNMLDKIHKSKETKKSLDSSDSLSSIRSGLSSVHESKMNNQIKQEDSLNSTEIKEGEAKTKNKKGLFGWFKKKK